MDTEKKCPYCNAPLEKGIGTLKMSYPPDVETATWTCTGSWCEFKQWEPAPFIKKVTDVP